MLRLLIAVDGSAHAPRAIEVAARLQPQTAGLDIVQVHVRDVPTCSNHYPPLVLPRARQQADGLGDAPHR